MLNRLALLMAKMVHEAETVCGGSYAWQVSELAEQCQ
jgi:hypothetical protein